LGTVGARVDQMHVQLSPDGARVAVSELDPTRNTRDITIYDLTRNGLRRKLTFDPADEFSVVWSHEGAGLTFSSNRKGKFDIYHKASSGAGAEELLLDDARNNVYPTSLSPDGRFLLYHTGYAASATSNDIWVLPLFGDRKPLPVVQTPAAETGGQFSPNGRWVAYQSSELGQLRVFVVPFSVSGKGSGGATTPEGKWQVSTGIGTAPPRWRRDGKELFYATPDGLMAAEVNGEGSTFEVGAVRSLFDVRRRAVGWLGSGPGASYDVSADGERFLVNTAVEELVAPPATVVVNWTAGLRK
jgi:Tol biopolymer transport system component